MRFSTRPCIDAYEARTPPLVIINFLVSFRILDIISVTSHFYRARQNRAQQSRYVWGQDGYFVQGGRVATLRRPPALHESHVLRKDRTLHDRTERPTSALVEAVD